MSSETKVILGIVLSTVLIFVVGIVLINNQFEAKNSPKAADMVLLQNEASFSITSDPSKPTFYEFADFQCPACAAFHPQVNELISSGQVNYVFRHYPLPSHKHAVIAAQAVEAAGEQSKFLEMADLLYENQPEWSNLDDPMEKFAQYAAKLNLDVEGFKSSVQSGKFEAKIQKDISDATRLGVNATPTFYVNNYQYAGSLKPDEIVAFSQKNSSQ